MTTDRKALYAVLRIDRLNAEDTLDHVLANPGVYITVKAVYDTMEQARAEVERLNQLPVPQSGAALYFWQTTRYIPPDQPSHGGDTGSGQDRPSR
ncbi:hypothetical protein [Nocardia terpenica]|uniref:Uncharacterized protein n=1 Tax=Nocardia terpenica TaxID=455432 RepID=A0A164NQP0_9NOCA|nr:hypothetical protein [Nocardia terpenica]ATL70058.1 hypothetical protein CRH09_31600 [Nocardia terpenica]KZM74616.1 hypothetical protein AWN90_21270 [Nocardia terpenica]NQE93797.1 hypothetical protein [Nocardia terpenica]